MTREDDEDEAYLTWKSGGRRRRAEGTGGDEGVEKKPPTALRLKTAATVITDWKEIKEGEYKVGKYRKMEESEVEE
jgi:hypothetical protein